jgi:hypothetical protein
MTIEDYNEMDDQEVDFTDCDTDGYIGTYVNGVDEEPVIPITSNFNENGNEPSTIGGDNGNDVSSSTEVSPTTAETMKERYGIDTEPIKVSKEIQDKDLHEISFGLCGCANFCSSTCAISCADCCDGGHN